MKPFCLSALFIVLPFTAQAQDCGKLLFHAFTTDRNREVTVCRTLKDGISYRYNDVATDYTIDEVIIPFDKVSYQVYRPKGAPSDTVTFKDASIDDPMTYHFSSKPDSKGNPKAFVRFTKKSADFESHIELDPATATTQVAYAFSE